MRALVAVLLLAATARGDELETTFRQSARTIKPAADGPLRTGQASLSSGLQAAMIWSPSTPAGAQAYVAFRKTFELQNKASATLEIFADSRYMLWVNGQYLLRGPCRFNPKRPEFDAVELKQLKKGPNSLVVLVHHYPAINGRIMRHAPGLTARLEVGGREIFRTDKSWRACAKTEYLPSPNAWSSIPDVIDARKSPGDWTQTCFDDSQWETAVPVDGGAWGPLHPRESPLPNEVALTGMRLLPSGRELPSATPIALPEGAEFVVDLGRMAMAYATVDLDAEEGSVLQIQYALRYLQGRPRETYGVGTTYTARRGRQSFMAADQWCSRYVTVKCASGRMTIHGLRMVDRRYPFERLGSFQSSDEMLNRLWERSVRTIEAVSDDAYGSDARERNEWLQDPAEPNFITTRVALAGPGATGKPVYSDPRLLKNLLRHAALTQLDDGRILATFPTNRGPEDCHYVIEDYACQWVEALKLYYEATGDREYLAEMWTVLSKQIRWFIDRRTSRGLILAREYTSFDDPLAYITCEGTALNAFVYQALRDAAILAEYLDRKSEAKGYNKAAENLADSMNRHLWNEAEGTYNAGFVNGKRLGPTAHAALLALDRGVVPKERCASTRKWFLAHYQRPGSFHCCGNRDFMKMINDRAGIDMPVTYYWVFQELYRMDSAAMDREAVSEMRRRWGRMVAQSDDTGTLWETFTGSETCHNYGAVPAWFLSSYVLGVRVDGPVWKKRLVIEPRLADLTFARGVVVTEFGPVPVAWRLKDRDLKFSFTVPDSIIATLRVPGGDPSTFVCSESSKAATKTGRCAMVTIGPGKHEGHVALSDGTSTPTLHVPVSTSRDHLRGIGLQH